MSAVVTPSDRAVRVVKSLGPSPARRDVYDKLALTLGDRGAALAISAAQIGGRLEACLSDRRPCLRLTDREAAR